MNKKRLALLLALALAAGLLAGCAGLGGSRNSVAGDWTAELDFTDAFKDYFQSTMDESMGEMGDYIDPEQIFDLSKLDAVMVWDMSFQKDGAASMTIDTGRMAQSMGQVMEDMKENLIAALPDIMEASLAQEGMTMAEVEEQLAQAGLSMDDLMDEMEQELESSFASEIDAQLDELDMEETESGYYVVDGDRIYLLDSKGDKPSQDSFMEFELRDGDLVITDLPQEFKESFEELEEMGVSILPLTFHRA